MEVKSESSKHMGRERTNFARKNCRNGTIEMEGEGGKATFPFVILSVTGLAIVGERGKRLSQYARRLRFWEENQYAYFQEY